jgi:hypothetical protein
MENTKTPERTTGSGSCASPYSALLVLLGNRGQKSFHDHPNTLGGLQVLFDNTDHHGVSVVVSRTATIEAVRAASLHLQNLHAEMTMMKESKRREYEESIRNGEYRDDR